MNIYIKIILFILIYQSAFAQEQTVYVIDQIQVGLHTEKSLQSPIIKLIPSGTSLGLVKQEEELSYVREPSGMGGWVDTSYISNYIPANMKIKEAQERIRNLETLLNNARQGQTSEEINNLMKQIEGQAGHIQQLTSENEGLNQQIQSSNADSLYEKIDQLYNANKQLESQLASILEAPSTAISSEDSEGTSSILTLRNILILSAITTVLGIILGIYIMDVVNRKRHGGFRV
jgi:SH3 domain protein